MFIGGICDWPYSIENASHVLDIIAQDRQQKILVEGFNNQYYNQIGYEQNGIRFVVDIDCKLALQDDDILNIVQCVNFVLYRYFRVAVDVFVSRCGPRPKMLNNEFYTKDGLHLIAHVCVTISQSVQMLHSISQYMQRQYPALHQKIDLDNNIYRRANGSVSARLLYSSKHIECNDCWLDQGVRLDVCRHCYRGKLRGSPKLPIMYTYYDQPRNRIQVDFQKTHISPLMTLKNHSVWCLNPKKERSYRFQIPQGFSLATDHHSITTSLLNQKKRKQLFANTAKRNKKAKNTDKHLSIPDSLFQALVRHIYIQFPGLYNQGSIQMTSAKLYGTQQVNIYLNSKVCFHLKRTHTSSKIWLCLHKRKLNTLTMRCFSDKMHHKRVEFRLKIEPHVYNAIWNLTM